MVTKDLSMNATDNVPTDYFGQLAKDGTYATFTEDEINWLRTYPDGITAVADYHSVRETDAAAQDFPEAAEFHKKRRLELRALAQHILKVWEES